MTEWLAGDCSCASDAAFLRSTRPPYEALSPRIRIVDLFAGCGGLTLGVAEAARGLALGTDVRLAVDSDPDAVAVYRANMPTANVRLGRVEDLFDGVCGDELSQVEKAMRTQVGPVDILVGGPPCQGHSDLNNRTRRDDPRNELYARMARAAEVLNPTMVLIENVPTVRHDVGKVVEATVGTLATLGYVVAETVLDASLFGAAQRRRRHVVLASRDPEVAVGEILGSTRGQCPQHPVRSVRWAIGDLDKSGLDGLFDSASTASTKNGERIAWLFEHRAYNLPNRLRPVCHQSNHSYNSMYGRLRWSEPAQTLTTGFGSIGQGRYVHPGRRRTITPHEAARLQMLPDFWDFGVIKKRGALATLIGNAVPPVLASALLAPALRAIGFAPATGQPQYQIRARPNKPRSPSMARRGTRRSGVPAASSPEARNRMVATRGKDTAAELAIRAAVDALGLEYRSDAPVPGTRRRADMIFGDAGVAVFVDGCFWHRCPIHASSPRANSEWWARKLEENRRRDEDTDRRLHAAGWTVLRFWEHEDPDSSAVTISAVVSRRIADKAARLPATGSHGASK
jgi:DNA (cytosine-5)-methyltransferase 1